MKRVEHATGALGLMVFVQLMYSFYSYVYVKFITAVKGDKPFCVVLNRIQSDSSTLGARSITGAPCRQPSD